MDRESDKRVKISCTENPDSGYFQEEGCDICPDYQFCKNKKEADKMKVDKMTVTNIMVRNMIIKIVESMNRAIDLWELHSTDWDPDRMAEHYPFGQSFDEIQWTQWRYNLLGSPDCEPVSKGDSIGDLGLFIEDVRTAYLLLKAFPTVVEAWAVLSNRTVYELVEITHEYYPIDCSEVDGMGAWINSLGEYRKKLIDDHEEIDDNSDELVPEGWACPICNERDKDTLDPLDGGGKILCNRCRIIYDIEDDRKVIAHSVYTDEDKDDALYGVKIPLSDRALNILIDIVLESAEAIAECMKEENDYRDAASTGAIANELFEIANKLGDIVEGELRGLTKEEWEIVYKEAKDYLGVQMEVCSEDKRVPYGDEANELMIIKGAYLTIEDRFNLLSEEDKSYLQLINELGIQFDEWNIFLILEDLQRMKIDPSYRGMIGVEKREKSKVGRARHKICEAIGSIVAELELDRVELTEAVDEVRDILR